MGKLKLRAVYWRNVQEVSVGCCAERSMHCAHLPSCTGCAVFPPDTESQLCRGTGEQTTLWKVSEYWRRWSACQSGSLVLLNLLCPWSVCSCAFPWHPSAWNQVLTELKSHLQIPYRFRMSFETRSYVSVYNSVVLVCVVVVVTWVQTPVQCPSGEGRDSRSDTSCRYCHHMWLCGLWVTELDWSWIKTSNYGPFKSIALSDGFLDQSLG